MSLIQRQEQAISLMMRPRTSDKRTARMHARVLRDYRNDAKRMGYTDAQIAQQVQDIRDMYALDCACAE